MAADSNFLQVQYKPFIWYYCAFYWHKLLYRKRHDQHGGRWLTKIFSAEEQEAESGAGESAAAIHGTASRPEQIPYKALSVCIFQGFHDLFHAYYKGRSFPAKLLQDHYAALHPSYL
jgi:hypothetical protein